MSTINFFNQYSYFFQKLYHDKRLNTQHISLYLVLFYLWNKYRFPLYLYEYRNVLKQYSKIGSYSTYYKCLRELSEWRYIVYFPGNEIGKKTKIQIIILEKTQDYTEELCLPLTDTESYQSDTDLYQQNVNNSVKTDTESYQEDSDMYQADSESYQYGYRTVSINRQTINKTNKDSLEQHKPKKKYKNKIDFKNALSTGCKEKEKKVAKKKEKDPDLLFTSLVLQEKWTKLLSMPKWRKKPEESIIQTFERLKKYEEEFVLDLLESAISGNWQGVIFPETDMKYAQWLHFKKNTHNGNRQALTNGTTRNTENNEENIQPQRNYKKRF